MEEIIMNIGAKGSALRTVLNDPECVRVITKALEDAGYIHKSECEKCNKKE